MTKPEFDRDKARKAQREFCNEKNYPMFAPYSGICFHCKKDIYKEEEQKRGDYEYKTGYSLRYATNKHVTGCPHCNYSFCD